MEPTLRLITIRISHYCEKARWALDRTGLTYVEECHLPPLHRLKTQPLGASSVPVLVTETDVLKTSDAILRYLDTITTSQAKLYPTASELYREVVELENRFNRKLGTAARQWGYFYGLQDRALMKQVWCDGVPKWEKSLFPILFPLTRRLVYSSYNVHRESAIAAYGRIQRIFETVSHRLSDGRQYLVGDFFSAADLTFACLAAPVVFPAEYGGLFPSLDQVSDEMSRQAQALRQTPAGEYVLRLYREERHVVSNTLDG